MAELEQKYSVPEQPIYPLAIQPLNLFEHLSENNYVQTSKTDQSSTSTAASISGSSCSQFNTFDYEDST